MCVKLRSPETRRRLISQARLLGNSTTEWHKRVFLNPNLTLEQRNRDCATREELKRRIQNGEENLTIRNFEVVPFHRPAHGGHQNVGRDIAYYSTTHHDCISDPIPQKPRTAATKSVLKCMTKNLVF